MLLALDTATDFTSIALYDGEQVLGEQNWRSFRRHTVELMPQVDALLRLLDVRPAALSAVAVSIGPGSYTGTRVAVSLGKGIVAANDLPLIGIPTLDALAYPHLRPDQPLCALVAAGRGRYCWASYAAGSGASLRQAQGRLLRSSEWGLHRLPEILPQLTPPHRFVGEISGADQEILRQTWGADAEIIPAGLAVRRAGALAELAWLRLQAGDSDDPAALSPIYLSSNS